MSSGFEPTQSSPADKRAESTGQLLSELSAQTSALVRQEIALAKAELAQQGKRAGKGGGMFGAAAVMGLALLGAFTAFLILVIAQAIPAWGAALVVTALYALITGVLALAGRKEIQAATPPAPQTVETVKEDVAWAKTQTKSANR